MTDSYVQVATDGSGKKIDNTTLTREPETQGSSGETIYRQRVVIGADDNPRQQVSVSGEAGDVALQVDTKTMGEILAVLTEIRDMLRMTIGA